MEIYTCKGYSDNILKQYRLFGIVQAGLWLQFAFMEFGSGAFCYLTNLTTLLTFVYFILGYLRIERFADLTSKLLAIVTVSEVFCGTLYYIFIKPRMSFELSYEYDVSVHIFIPLTVIFDTWIHQFRLEWKDFKYPFMYLLGYAMFLPLHENMYGKPVYPMLRFEDFSSFTLMLYAAGAIAPIVIF